MHISDSLGAFIRRSVGISRGATSDPWKMVHGFVHRRLRCLKMLVCRLSTSTLTKGCRQSGVSQGTDRFMELVEDRLLCQPTSTKQFGGSWKYDLFYIF